MVGLEFRDELNLKRRDRGFFMDFENIKPSEVIELNWLFDKR